MKKCVICVALLLFLTGCGAQETFETLQDSYDIPAAAIMREVYLELPKEAMVPSMENEDAGKLYLCSGFTVTVQTLEAGDLNRTVRSLTGYDREGLTILETSQGEFPRYDFVWTCAGEGGDQVGKAVVIDDGSYHYCVTAMTDASQTEALAGEWEDLFRSFWVA